MKEVPISEYDHQTTVIEWCELMAKGKYPMLRWIYAVPNGARVSWKTAKKLKAEGLKAGVPDLCLPWPIWYETIQIEGEPASACSCPGLYIEMKTKGGRVKPHQKEWLDYLDSVGYRVKTAWSSKEATDTIEEYLNGS